MSFRLRALVVIMTVAVVASSATAWLTLQQARQQVHRSTAADQADVNQVTSALTEYGFAHRNWSAVAFLVRELRAATGQRIRMLTSEGVLIADSDLLAGHPAEPVAGAPLLIDPVAHLNLPEGSRAEKAQYAGDAFRRYTSAESYGACLARSGRSVRFQRDAGGIPLSPWQFVQSPGPQVIVASCQRISLATYREVNDFIDAVRGCPESLTGSADACLTSTFTRFASRAAPPPAEVYLGAITKRQGRLSGWPSLALAGAVSLIVILAALLISRGAIRSVSQLTSAAHSVAAGDFGQRVQVIGHDEFAALGDAFNQMAQALQDSERRQQQLVDDVAHELRTPLANVRGYLEALRDGVLQPTSDVLESMFEEALLQQRIVDDLQVLALAEAGMLSYQRTSVSLAQLLASTEAGHRQIAASAGVTIGIGEAAGVINGDFSRLRQVLGNLVTNAIRATPAGGSVRLTSVLRGNKVLVEVTDTGSGISPADVPHLFDRFWRADRARGRTTGGAGLGLAIACQIVSAHGGRIDVESAPGVGSTFRVHLPAA